MAPPNISLSPSEAPAFAHLWRLADPNNTGLVTGEAAVRFFAPARLPAATLGQIWALADRDQNGLLNPAAFSVALRLIGHAQRGSQVAPALIDQAGPPPSFEGITLPTAPAPVSAAASFAAPSAPASTSGIATGSSLPPLTPDDKQRYGRIFASAAPAGGLLDGEKARDIFVKSNLPWDKLGAIWSLADTKTRGALDLTDFTLGMYFIQHTMNGDLSSIPSVLPLGLYEQASGGPVPNVAGNSSSLGGIFGQERSASPLPIGAQTTGTSAYGRAPSVIQRQYSGASAVPAQSTGGIPAQYTGQIGVGIPAQYTGSHAPGIPAQYTGTQAVRAQHTGLSTQHTGRSVSGAFVGATGGGGSAVNWDVAPTEKTNYDRYFDGLDIAHTGALEGTAVVPFLMQSKLDEGTLAQVWDLADITQSGSLSREEFAVAMHLINGKLGGRDVPDRLPSTLVPPSLRNVAIPEPPTQTDTQKDLFSLMDDDEPVPQPPIRADSAFQPAILKPSKPSSVAGSARGSVVASPTVDTAAPVRAGSTNQFDDAFSPRSVSRVASPAASASARSAVPPAGATHINVAPPVSAVQSPPPAPSTNQESNIFDVAASAMGPGRYGEVQAELETERKAVRELESKAKVQTEETNAVRADLIHEESSLSALKASKDELEQTLLKDREETRGLRTQVSELEAQTATLQAEVEKLRKAARHQKGLHTIAQKQLVTAHSDHERLTHELEDLKNPQPEPETSKQIDEAPHSEHGDAASAAAAAVAGAGLAGAAGAGAAGASKDHQVVPAHPGLSEPTQSVTSQRSTNPFGLPSDAPTSAAPTAASAPSANGFDDAFGSFDAPAAPAAAERTTAQSGLDDAFASFDPPAPAPTAGQGQVQAQAPVSHVAAPIPAAQEEDSSSDEDDEGPEDLDHPRTLRPGLNQDLSTTLASSRRAPPAVPQRAPVPTTTAPQQPARTTSALDDFDSAFSNFGPASGTTAPTTSAAAAPQGFDDPFEPDFSFGSVAGGAPHATAPQSSAVANDAFGGFDDAFGAPPAPLAAAVPSASASNGTKSAGANAFDDAFGAPPVPTPAAPAPAAAATAPTPTQQQPPLPPTRPSAQPAEPISLVTEQPAETDDAHPVKQLTAMGFPRAKVLAALEASNYRVDRALERLLSSA